ncbi:MAG: hypothetical protein NC033_06495 [Clostridiales bacterium]|nr:hypothetical protein [Clostridiales bacterium]
MTEVDFMQLLVLALILLLSGKNANIKELKPIIEELGGGEAAEAFRQAEELSGVINAVQSLAGMPQQTAPPAPCEADTKSCGEGFPLAPIANIADERITYCLSRYIACGE